MKRTKSTPMSPLTPYAEPEDVRRKLAEDYRRRATGRRRKKEPEADAPPTPAPAPWTPERFTVEFVRPTPTPKATVMARASAQGLSARRADGLCRLAIDAGLIHPWSYPATRAIYLASIAQPVTETVEAPK